MPESDESRRKIVSFLCTHCGVNATGEVVASYEEGDGEGIHATLLQIAKCLNCSQSLLLIEEDYGKGWDGRPVAAWPPSQLPLSWLIPENLRRELAEAQRCYSVQAYTATAVMVRRTLEGVCIDQMLGGDSATIRGRPLQKMLESLRDSGKIEGRLFEWTQALRVLGNQGAHFTGDAVSEDDAADALALAEALLDYIYVYSAQFEKFSARRALRIEQRRNLAKEP
ncbi:DUF4145 domain-containing protein [Kitasatospora sp. NPDC056446]|uniref:DUF4145 domain-containing protein n=1 Tax=Kitasatospora sp. NPDC056446 TaxID=3345819 RepID=UPI00368C5259